MHAVAMITSPTRSGRARISRGASGSANFAEEVIGVIIPRAERAVARFGKAAVVRRFVGEQLGESSSELVRVVRVCGGAAAGAGDFANGPIDAADAGPAVPEALQNRQAESLAQRRVYRKRTIPIRFVQRVVADVTQPPHGPSAFGESLDFPEDCESPVLRRASD